MACPQDPPVTVQGDLNVLPETPQPAPPVTPPTPGPTPLDQHERHPNGLPTDPATTVQGDPTLAAQDPPTTPPVDPPLDQHERHPTNPDLGGNQPQAPPPLGPLGPTPPTPLAGNLLGSTTVTGTNTLGLQTTTPPDPTTAGPATRGPTIGPRTDTTPRRPTDPTKQPGHGGYPAGSIAETGYLAGEALRLVGVPTTFEEAGRNTAANMDRLGLDGTIGGFANAVAANTIPGYTLPGQIAATVQDPSAANITTTSVNALVTGVSLVPVLKGAATVAERIAAARLVAAADAPVATLADDLVPVADDLVPVADDLVGVADENLPAFPKVEPIPGSTDLYSIDGTPTSVRTGLAAPAVVPKGFRADATLPREVKTIALTCQIGQTCAPTAASMVLNDLGIPVSAAELVRDAAAVAPPGQIGTTTDELLQVIEKHGGVGEIIRVSSVEDLLMATRDGPVLAATSNFVGFPGAEHLLVVDQVLGKEGQMVVAIRNPDGGQAYYQLAEDFMRGFTGETIKVTVAP